MAPEFGREDSWIILSPIEQSIKRKIEAVGTPLKDWDINIYRGILTGYNEAFIIDSAKRNELLTNCKDKNEREKTDELIRPILRGRDIKRYGYSFADIYLIASHNGYINSNGNWVPRIDMNDYPKVKQHLDFFEPKLSSRADQGDTPYNLRSCAYMNDFSKPKIVWIELVERPNFALDEIGIMIKNTAFFITGKHIHFLIAYLNSTLCDWQFGKICATSVVGTRRWIKQYIEQICIPSPSDRQNDEMKFLVEKLERSDSNTKAKIISKIDEKFFELSNLNNDERNFVSD